MRQGRPGSSPDAHDAQDGIKRPDVLQQRPDTNLFLLMTNLKWGVLMDITPALRRIVGTGLLL